MCELFGVTANRKIRINGLLKTFFDHSIEHQNGWGLALFDDKSDYIEKESVQAVKSLYLKNRLNRSIETSRCIAHIRKATIGDINFNNTHPFSKCDASGRRWTLAHNGTIFESPLLFPYQYTQEGTTDSERILLYLIDEINKCYEKNRDICDSSAKMKAVDDTIRKIVPGNKLNLMIYDGECFYVHKNEQGTLYKKEEKGCVVFSTQPLEQSGWVEVPQNQLVVYKDGALIYTGQKHNNTYIHDEEKMKMLYFAFSGL